MTAEVLRPEDSLGFHGVMTHRAIFAALEGRLKGTGVSPVQYVALGYLVSSDRRTQSDLAGVMSVSGPTCVRLVDRMERDGLVRREPGAKDGRVKMLIPTAKGVALWEQIGYAGPEVLREAYEGISAKEMDTVKDVLARVRHNLNALP